MKSKKKEKFKCLICSNQFLISKERWIEYNSEINSGKHIDDIKKILCPICNASQVQHLGSESNKRNKTTKSNKIINFYEKISSILGIVLGESIAPFVYIWKNNSLKIVEQFLSFFIFIFAILLVKKIINLGDIYSSVLVVIYLILNNFKRK